MKDSGVNRLEQIVQDFLQTATRVDKKTFELDFFDFVVADLILKVRKDTKAIQKKWEQSLVRVLGDKIPVTYKGRRNPRRLFPHEVTGELKNSIYTKFDVRQDDMKISFIYTFGFSSVHSILTDEGYTKRGRRTTQGQWVDWMKDVFYGNPRLTVRSAKYLLEKYFDTKRLKFFITK